MKQHDDLLRGFVEWRGFSWAFQLFFVYLLTPCLSVYFKLGVLWVLHTQLVTRYKLTYGCRGVIKKVRLGVRLNGPGFVKGSYCISPPFVLLSVFELSFPICFVLSQTKICQTSQIKHNFG